MLKKFHKIDKTDIHDISLRRSMQLGEDDVKTLVKELESDRKFHRSLLKQNSQIINGSTVDNLTNTLGTGTGDSSGQIA